MNERITKLARQAGFNDFPDDKNGIWITDGYWDEQLERFAELVRQDEREYEIHSKDPVYRIIRACGMSTANSDINVFALEKIIADIKAEEREACANLCEDLFNSDGDWCAKSIRGRTE